jgi:hypothetical protein
VAKRESRRRSKGGPAVVPGLPIARPELHATKVEDVTSCISCMGFALGINNMSAHFG